MGHRLGLQGREQMARVGLKRCNEAALKAEDRHCGHSGETERPPAGGCRLPGLISLFPGLTRGSAHSGGSGGAGRSRSALCALRGLCANCGPRRGLRLRTDELPSKSVFLRGRRQPELLHRNQVGRGTARRLPHLAVPGEPWGHMVVFGERGLARVWRMKSREEKERGWGAGMKNRNRNRRGEQTQHKSEKQRPGGQCQT